MELGPIQKAWVKRLRQHPERQFMHKLGERYENGSYKACCLGEGMICANELLGIETKWVGEDLVDYTAKTNWLAVESLKYSYEKLGLGDSTGSFLEGYPQFTSIPSLASMNDAGLSWLKIADFIENHPEVVFVKSV